MSTFNSYKGTISRWRSGIKMAIHNHDGGAHLLNKQKRPDHLWHLQEHHRTTLPYQLPIRSRHASHTSRNEAVGTLPHTHGHSHNHNHIHSNGHASGANGHAGVALNASSLHRDTLHHQGSNGHAGVALNASSLHRDTHHQGSTRSKHDKVASVLARLSERSHSLPGSRNSTLTNDHVSVLPDGHVNPDISFSHVIPDPHNPSRRSKNHRNPFTGHLEHRSPSVPIHVNHSEIHQEPDLLMTTLPRIPGGSRHSTLSRQHSMGHRSHLSLAHDTEQDYYIHANRARYKDEARKQRFNLQTVMLIGCYTMLFVVAIIVGVVLCQQNGWLGFGNHHSDSSKSVHTPDNTRGRRPNLDYPDIIDNRPRNNNRLPTDTTRVGVAGVGNIPRNPPQRPPANGGHQLLPGGNNGFVNSGSDDFGSSSSGKSFIDPLRAFNQDIDGFDFNSNNNQGFANNNLGLQNPTRGNSQGSVSNFGTNIGTNNNRPNNNQGVNNFNNPSNANNRGGLANFGIGSTSDQGSFDINNSQGAFDNRNNQGMSNNGNLGNSGSSFNDNSGFSGNEANHNNGGFNQGTSSIRGGFGSSGINNKNNAGLSNSASAFGNTENTQGLGAGSNRNSNSASAFGNTGNTQGLGAGSHRNSNSASAFGNTGNVQGLGAGSNRNTQGILNNLSGSNTQTNFDNDGFHHFEMRDNQGTSAVRNNQGSQNRNNPNNQNRNIPGNQSINNQGNQNRNNQGNQNRNNQGNQNRSNQGNQNRNNQGTQSKNNQGNQSRNNQGSFGNTGQGRNQGNSNNNQMGFGITGSRNNNSPRENESKFGNDGFNGNTGSQNSQFLGNGNINIDAGFVKSQGVSNAQNPFGVTGRRSNQGTSSSGNSEMTGIRNTANSGSRNGQNGVNLPGLSNTGNVQQGSGSRNGQNGVNLPGLPNTRNVQQGSGSRNGQHGVNLSRLSNTENVQQGSGSQNGQTGVKLPGLSNTGNVQQGSGNTFSQGDSRQTSLNQNSNRNGQRPNSQPSSRTPARNNVVGSSPNQVSANSNVNRQNVGVNRQSSQIFNTNNGVPATNLLNGVSNINRQNVGPNLQTGQNLNQPGRMTDSDMMTAISANLPKPIHPPGKKGENWNSQKGSQLQHSGSSRQGGGRSLKNSDDNINIGIVPNAQSPSSIPKNQDRKLPSVPGTINHTIMNELLTIPNILGGGISVQHGNLMSQSTLSMVNGDVIPAILRPTPDIIVHINPDGIGAGVTLETTRSSTSRTTSRPVTAVSTKTRQKERVQQDTRIQSNRAGQANSNSNSQRTSINRPGQASIFFNRNQSSRPPVLQSPPRASSRPSFSSIGIPLPTITQRTPSQQQIPRVSQAMSRSNSRPNAHLSVKPNQDVTITVDNSKSRTVSNVRGTTKNTAAGVNRQNSRTQPSQNRQVVRAWTHTDTEGTFSQGQVRSDGSFIFTNCKPAGSCIP